MPLQGNRTSSNGWVDQAEAIQNLTAQANQAEIEKQRRQAENAYREQWNATQVSPWVLTQASKPQLPKAAAQSDPSGRHVTTNGTDVNRTAAQAGLDTNRLKENLQRQEAYQSAMKESPEAYQQVKEQYPTKPADLGPVIPMRSAAEEELAAAQAFQESKAPNLTVKEQREVDRRAKAENLEQQRPALKAAADNLTQLGKEIEEAGRQILDAEAKYNRDPSSENLQAYMAQVTQQQRRVDLYNQMYGTYETSRSQYDTEKSAYDKEYDDAVRYAGMDYDALNQYIKNIQNTRPKDETDREKMSLEIQRAKAYQLTLATTEQLEAEYARVEALRDAERERFDWSKVDTHDAIRAGELAELDEASSKARLKTLNEELRRLQAALDTAEDNDDRIAYLQYAAGNKGANIPKVREGKTAKALQEIEKTLGAGALNSLLNEGTNPAALITDEKTLDASIARLLPYMDKDEKNAFRTFVNSSDWAHAGDFLDTLRPKLEAMAAKADTEAITKYGEKNFGTAAASTFMAGTLGALGAQTAYFDNLYTALNNKLVDAFSLGKYRTSDVNSGAYAASRAAQDFSGAAQAYNAKVGEQNKLLGDALNQLSGATSSALSNVIQMAMFGKYMLPVMATQAAGSKTTEMLRSGASAEDAAFMSTMSGIVEYLTEKVPLEHMLDRIGQIADLKKGGLIDLPDVMRMIRDQGMEEASEEVIGNIAENLIDIAYNGSNSEFGKFESELRMMGYSNAEARTQAFNKFFVGDSIEAAVSAFISSAMLLGPTAVMQNSQMRKIGNQVLDHGSAIEEAAKALELPDSEDYAQGRKAGLRVQEALDAGKQIDPRVLGYAAERNSAYAAELIQQGMDLQYSEAQAMAYVLADRLQNNDPITQKELRTLSSQIEKDSVDHYTTEQLETAGRNIENAAPQMSYYATQFMRDAGLSAKDAQERCIVLNDLLRGETDIPYKDFQKLDMDSAVTRRVFTELTGIEIPEGVHKPKDLKTFYKLAPEGAAAKARQEAVANDRAILEQAYAQQQKTQILFKAASKALQQAAQERAEATAAQQRAIEESKARNLLDRVFGRPKTKEETKNVKPGVPGRPSGRDVSQPDNGSNQQAHREESELARDGKVRATGERVSAAEANLEGGSTIAIARKYTKSDYTDKMKSVEKKNAKLGVKTVFLDNNLVLRAKNGEYIYANGVWDPKTKTIYINANHSRWSVEEINGHEMFHAMKDDIGLSMEDARDQFVEDYDQETYDKIVDLYEKRLGEGLTDLEYFEEFLADANGGLQRIGSIDVQAYHDFAAGLVEQKNTAETAGGETKTSVDTEYTDTTQPDITRKYKKTVHDILDGTIRTEKTVLMGYTPDLFVKLGLPRIPFVVGSGHIYSMAKTKAEAIAERRYRSGVHYHGMGEAAVQDLYEKIKDPIMVIAAKDVDPNEKPLRSTHSVVAIVDIGSGTEHLLMPVAITRSVGSGKNAMDVNMLSTSYPRDVSALIREAVAQYNTGEKSIFYVKKGEAGRLYDRAGVQFPLATRRAPSSLEGIIHQIPEKVNMEISHETQSTQFLRWFGDWLNNRGRVSKAVNKNGEPMVLYHNTNADGITVFDPDHGGGQGRTHGDGVYLSSSPTEFAYAGKNQYQLYASIKNPFEMQLTRNQARRVLEKYGATKHDLDKYDGLYRKHAMEKLRSPTRVFDYLTEYAEDNGIKVSDILKDLGFDGVHDGPEWVAFDPAQVKSATDNVGTFDKKNPDIRFSQDTDNEQRLDDLEAQRQELIDQLDFAEGSEAKELNNRLAKVNYEIDRINAEERRAAVSTPIGNILKNLDDYRRIDLISIGNQYSDGNWDGIESLTKPELVSELREVLQNQADEDPGIRYYVRPVTSQNDNITRVRFSQETDPEVLEKLENEPTVTVYRAMQEIDGKLYPPMAAKLDDGSGKRKLVEPTTLGTWYRADEHPELLDENGKFKLDKANGSTPLNVAYNPYWHTSRSLLNDQFSSAHKRPNLVTVECEVPASELTSGYKAEGAKDAVGEMYWHSGPVSTQLAKLGNPRRVILSRWVKVNRVVPDAEAARNIAQMLDGTDIDIPANTVTPSLRSALEAEGVRVTENNRVRFSQDTSEDLSNPMGADMMEEGLTSTDAKGWPVGYEGDQPLRYEEKFSVDTTVDALNLRIEKEGDAFLLYDEDGNRVEKVTPEMVKDSPLGWMLRQGAKGDDLKKQYEFFAQLIDSFQHTQDLDMIYAITSLGFQPFEAAQVRDYDRKKGVFGAYTSNSDPQYSTTVDFTTICLKTQQIVDVMSQTMMDLGRGLTEDEIVNIVYKATHEAGEPVPCPVCYVFSRWVGLGGLFSQIDRLQEKYRGLSREQVQARRDELLRRSMDILQQRKMANPDDVKAQKAKNPTAKDRAKVAEMIDERINELYAQANVLRDKQLKHRISSKLPGLTEAEQSELDDLEADLEALDEWAWVNNVVLNKNYKPVPKKVLYNINAGTEFARDYSTVWKYRTTRGPAMGKATTPYAPAVLGQFVTGRSVATLNSKNENLRLAVEKNPFRKPEGNSDAEKKLNAARKNAKAQNLIGGQRYQSTSDFRFEYALDYLLSFVDLQAIGSKVQLYTKVPEAVPFLASVGADVNCSLMPLGKGWGTDADGNRFLRFSSVTGMNEREAFAFSAKYDNVQPIMVGLNRTHIELCLADDRITFVIPYHASGAPEARYYALMEAVGEKITKDGRT
ncbi:MAG: hypothetical protein II008_03970, partial [Oscillospiraceae bacterium]|nr:hypothetical protein [Oscillospiraceae bacterium]